MSLNERFRGLKGELIIPRSIIRETKDLSRFLYENVSKHLRTYGFIEDFETNSYVYSYRVTGNVPYRRILVMSNKEICFSKSLLVDIRK